MSNLPLKIFRVARSIVRVLLLTVLGLFVLVNVFILLSGRFYIYNGIRHTYLIGKTGPGIYDLDIFPKKTLEKPEKSENWPQSTSFNQYALSSKDEKYIQYLKTTAFLVFKNDSLVYEKYYGGHMVNTVSNSFSAAKTVVALLIGIAIDEGKIKSIDEPVSNYIPEFRDKNRKIITIRHLLMMASGLDWEESSSNPLSENAESYYGWDLYKLVTSQKRIAEPGKMFKYQSGNSQLLGFILEKATGQSVAEYAQEKLWKEIGTEHDAYWSLDKENGDEKAFCCLYATARDFGKLGKLILHKGRWNTKQIIPSWYMKLMSLPVGLKTEENVSNLRYGLHLWTYTENGKTISYCRGIKGQYIISVPQENIVIVRLGMDRNENYTIPEEKKNDQQFIFEHEGMVGHPIDFFEYLRLGREIAYF